ncbi:TetR/AcrR family transcriptional regulator [Saccharopolyspora sp. TS4A08]|uniref:TetR/AcrR family transcriptional regulator n=1 Tax=Saccharopolyspora ipomoeae TaxID=3042027 RepID=A0ABT6PR09_9PSEU|nr:TetR/AcrR family transcriptional regulator [Saccharopolyspora sp. TS4A08]MDI2030403.1 TetR/AcrR family transcriptional regulator [Saccharopolyspora sp. TS4A08]
MTGPARAGARLGGVQGTAGRKQRTSQRRADIVTAAARIFAEQGYGNVGMRDIAEAVGIRGASLYHHFPAKEEILYAICLSVTREPVEETLPLLDAAGTPTERLTELIRAHIRHLLHRRVEYRVGQHERTSLTAEHRAEIDRYLQHYNQRVRDVLAAGMRSGEFREMNPKLAALGLLDMLNGVSNWIRGSTDAAADEVADTYVHLLLDGLRGSPGA